MVPMPEPLTLSDYGRLNAMLGPDRDSGEEAIRAALRTAAQLQHLQTMRMVFADRTGETFDPAKVTRNLERLSGQDLSEVRHASRARVLIARCSKGEDGRKRRRRYKPFPPTERQPVAPGIFAERRRLAPERSREVGERNAIGMGDAHRGPLVRREGTVVTVYQSKEVGAGEQRGPGPSHPVRERIHRHRPVERAQGGDIGLGPYRAGAKAVSLRMGAAQAEVTGTPAHRSGGATEASGDGREACRIPVRLAQQIVLLTGPVPAPAPPDPEATRKLLDRG
ncbi:hypothetical protein WR25_26021 [Diploscapter pachys]|uniref:Uncharacterized protein n=1 Tax=Diploscapter pachys TaxID=2018661 RepID=A0A2A2K4T0_9BILA|nr:hypothetical protein WR25_26021 [Diploscapter pachys]